MSIPSRRPKRRPTYLSYKAGAAIFMAAQALVDADAPYRDARETWDPDDDESTETLRRAEDTYWQAANALAALMEKHGQAAVDVPNREAIVVDAFIAEGKREPVMASYNTRPVFKVIPYRASANFRP
jgi:hypothetical protein